MKFKSLVAASLAMSLSAAPAIAAAPAAAPSAVVEPADESVDGSALYRTGILIPLAAIVALALVAYLIIDSSGDDEPASP